MWTTEWLNTVMFRTSFFARIPFLISAVLLMSTGCARPVHEDPVVLANGEELHGSWDDASNGIAIFKGIPFAAPPVADLRWRAPVANQPRSGPQKATEFAPACMQTAYMTDWYADVAKTFGAGPETVGRPNGVSEDCLYLNVWSPQLDPGARLPVMIWVHGGSNKGGWSYEPNYMGARLAAKGVLVVTIAYRLGAFGFFSHPSLDNGEGEPVANFGLLDVARAFRWVSDNIESFGGDPENITLIGESAGAGNISDLVATDKAEEPVYRRVILQSSASSLGQRRTLAEEQATGQTLIDSLAIAGAATAAQLRAIPAEDLLASYMKNLPGHYFDAVIDEQSMKQSPIDALYRADHTKLDVLVGTNADEWYMYIDENAGLADLEKTIGQSAPGQVSALMAKVSQSKDIRQAIDRIHTAGKMLCPSMYLAARVTELGGRGYVYYFSRQRPGPGGEKLGAYHGTEIPYVFDMHDDWLPTEDVDRELTKAVMDYWVQFAHSGDPNLPDSPEWPVYDAQRPLALELGDTIGAIRPRDLELCEWLGPRHGDKAKESGAKE